MKQKKMKQKKMKQKKITMVMASLCLMLLGLFFWNSAETTYAADTEMTLHGMYLGENSKGDSVLLESRGEYLLMDIGMYYGTPYVIEELEDLGIDHLTLYFSHLHMDHIGSSGSWNLTDGLEEFAESGITIDKLYLPAESLSPRSKSNPRRYEILRKYAEGKFPIEYLKVGDELKVGDVTGKVIGPIDEYRLSLYNAQGEASYGLYENNCSLVTIFTCGNIKYFTAGDIQRQQEDLLIERYGKELDCDIMKLNHHGQGSVNSEEFLSYVSPTYSFTTTPSYEPRKANGKWKNFRAVQRATEYGINYMIQNNGENIVIDVKNDLVTLYRGEDADSGTKLSGWVKVAGSDGKYHDTDMFYLDAQNKPLTGIQQIDGKYYNFGNGGRMVYGKYKKSGYSPWNTDENGTRAYVLDANGDSAAMQFGFAYVGDYRYYFDENGYRLEPEEEDVFTTIEGNRYVLDADGAFRADELIDMEDGEYYLNKKGEVVTDAKIDFYGTWYLFDEDGRMIGNDGKRAFYEFDGEMYAIDGDGAVYAGTIARIDGERYYFDDQGLYVTDEKVTVGNNTYYFDADGHMVTGKMVKIGQQKYYFGADGKMYADRNFKLANGKKYHADENGVVKQVKKVKKQKKADQSKNAQSKNGEESAKETEK